MLNDTQKCKFAGISSNYLFFYNGYVAALFYAAIHDVFIFYN
jgi:hypothetical protein